MDAATKLKEQIVGFRAVIRDSAGNSIAAAMKKSAFNGHVALAYAEAAKLRLESAEKATCVPLIVENDCQEIIELVTRTKCS